MYNQRFFGTKLGQASFASIAAMVAMIALTSQMNHINDNASLAQPSGETAMFVELA